LKKWESETVQRTSAECLRVLAERKSCSHKGENGKVLVVSGSGEYHGSAIFATLAASRFVDLVYVCTEKENIPALKKWCPNSIVRGFGEANELAKECDSILIGPGMEGKKARKTTLMLLKRFPEKKFVIDAIALWFLKPNELGKNCCVTPHAGEFKAFLGKKPCAENALRANRKFGFVVVLKGKTDCIASRGKLWENETGNALMTVGGTGDVLAGLITAFAAKNSLEKAALAGCWLNGKAGESLAKRMAGFNAMDLADELPVVMKKIS